MRLTAPDLNQPWAHHFNVGGTHQITQAVAVDFDYVHSIGKDEIHRWPINRVYSLPDEGIQVTNENTRISPAGVFNPYYGEVRVEGNRGHSQFDGVYLTGRVRLPRTNVLTSYAWTKANNLANDFGSNPGDPTNVNWEDDWGPTPNDVRHRFTLGATSAVWHDLMLSSIVQANTGKPFSALAGFSRVAQRRAGHRPRHWRSLPEELVPRGGLLQLGHAGVVPHQARGRDGARAAVRGLQHHEPHELRSRLLRDDLHVGELRHADARSSTTASGRPRSV